MLVTVEWRSKIYAIIKAGGKQYKVSPGSALAIDLIDAPEGNKIELGKVLLINNEGRTIVGNPIIEGAKVIAMSRGEVKGEKVLVGKFKAKTRYRRKKGHRQKYTQIEVQNIIEPGVKNGT